MRNEIKAVLDRLRKIEERVQGYYDKAEDEERQDTLSAELDSIQDAIVSLEEIE